MRYFLPPRRMIYLIEISRLIGRKPKKFHGFLVQSWAFNELFPVFDRFIFFSERFHSCTVWLSSWALLVKNKQSSSKLQKTNKQIDRDTTPKEKNYKFARYRDIAADNDESIASWWGCIPPGDIKRRGRKQWLGSEAEEKDKWREYCTSFLP